MGLLAGPRAGSPWHGGTLITALPAHRNRAGSGEAEAFRAVNGLPDSLHIPA